MKTGFLDQMLQYLEILVIDLRDFACEMEISLAFAVVLNVRTHVLLLIYFR